MDELADRLRHRPDRAAHPQRARRSTPRTGCRSARATSSSACARARERFGWDDRDPRPARAARAAGWSAPASPARRIPARRRPQPRSRARRPTGATSSGSRASDIGTGARTVLTQIAADALDVPLERVRVEIGDSALPRGVARRRLDGHRVVGHGGPRGLPGAARGGRRDGVRRRSSEDVKAQARAYSRHAFGAQFAEVHVDVGHGRGARRRACSASSRPAAS